MSPREREIRTRIDCRDRTARDTLASLVPICEDASTRGRHHVVVVAHLDQLNDSVSRLLKGLERLSDELGVRIILEDRSGFADAFRNALGYAHFDLRTA
jgi:hypothetical protein